MCLCLVLVVVFRFLGVLGSFCARVVFLHQVSGVGSVAGLGVFPVLGQGICLRVPFCDVCVVFL